MITPEDYYLEYKKLSLLISERVIYTIAIIIMILMLILMRVIIHFVHNSIVLFFILLSCAPIIHIFFSIFDKPINTKIRNVKISKLKKLINNNNITPKNFESKHQDYILVNLINILDKHNINSKIYESFYKNHLNNYLAVNKNILGDNIYAPFIFGSIYVGTLQAYYSLTNTTGELIISFIMILTFSLIIITVIHEIKKYTQSKYNSISKLVFYTEIIFQEQEQKNKKQFHI